MVTGIRHQTTVPQQALFLMNSPLVIDLARRLVARPEFVALTEDDAKLQYLYERIYQRLPAPEEVQLGEEFVNQTPLRDDASMAAAVAANDPPAKPNKQGKPKPAKPSGPGRK